MIDFLYLAQQCAPDVHADTMQRIVHVESSYNPYAIGVVGAHLDRQPRSRDEAIATVQWLEQNGYNYSMGLAQVNKKNLAKYGLTRETVFEACPNIRAGGEILKECFQRASKSYQGEQAALRAAFSCYYSGNFITGFKQGYVVKIVAAGGVVAKTVPAVVDGLPVMKAAAVTVASAGTNKKAKHAREGTSQTARASAPAATPETNQSAFLF